MSVGKPEDCHFSNGSRFPGNQLAIEKRFVKQSEMIQPVAFWLDTSKSTVDLFLELNSVEIWAIFYESKRKFLSIRSLFSNLLEIQMLACLVSVNIWMTIAGRLMVVVYNIILNVALWNNPMKYSIQTGVAQLTIYCKQNTIHEETLLSSSHLNLEWEKLSSKSQENIIIFFNT